MNILFELFSTRELASIIWFIILFIVLLIWDTGRGNLKGVVKAAFAPALVISYISLIIYIFVIIVLLCKCGYWDIFLLKDTIIWLLFIALGVFLGLSNVRDSSYFWKLFKSGFAATVFIEFFVNLYSFILLVELMLLPFIVFLTVLTVYSEHSSKTNKEHKKVNSCLNQLLSAIGLLYLGFAIYKTIVGFGSVPWGDVSKQFFLPILLTTLTIPYFWILALWMKYENMFIGNNLIFRDKSRIEKLEIKFFVLLYGNFNFKRVHRIWKKLGLLAYEEGVSYRKYIRQLASTPAYKKSPVSNKMSIGLFNDIDACYKALSVLNLGEFSEWNKLYGFDEFYCSPSYYTIKPDGLSNLLLSLQGEEKHIHQLELALSIYDSEEREESIQKFIECIESIANILSLQMPIDIYEAIMIGNGFSYSNDEYSVSLTFEINGRVESVVFTITSN